MVIPSPLPARSAKTPASGLQFLALVTSMLAEKMEHSCAPLIRLNTLGQHAACNQVKGTLSETGTYMTLPEVQVLSAMARANKLRSHLHNTQSE
jgi:hypothetical protein